MYFHSSRRNALLCGLFSLGLILGWNSIGNAQYIWNGPLTGTTGWSVGPWIGGTPTSSPTTTLSFYNYDSNSFSASNDFASQSINPFNLNGVMLQSYSTSSLTVTNLASNAIELTGSNPFVTQSSPTSVTFVSSVGNGLVLAPTSGTTTVGGNGNLTIGNTAAAVIISGTGGFTINQTGLGTLTFFSPTAGNTFTGGVTLDNGNLAIGSALAIGTNTLTIDGGTLRGTSTITNPVTANANLILSSSTLTLNGIVSGPGGVQVNNGLTFNSAGLTLGAADTYAGATTLGNAITRVSTSNYNSLTISSTGSISSTQPITLGNYSFLNLSGNNTHILNSPALYMNNGVLSLAGVSGGSLSEIFGSTTVDGMATFSLTTGATSNTLNLGTLTRINNAAVFIRGIWNGVTSSTGNLYFTNGSSFPISDPNWQGGTIGTGLNVGIIPFLSGNSSSTALQAQSAATYISGTGTGTGVRLIGVTSATSFAQIAAGGVIDSTVAYENVNIAGASASINSSVQINALAFSAASTAVNLTGTGTVSVYSGSVITGTPTLITFNGPILDFGTATGFINLGTQISISGSSQITGGGGVVAAGMDLGTTVGVTVNKLSLSNNFGNPFTGGLYLNGNANVSFTADNQLGAAGQPITLAGGLLTMNSGNGITVTVNRPISLGAAGGGFQTISGNTLIVAGNISGSGNLTIPITANGGTVILSGTNSYSGTTYVGSGMTLGIYSDSNLGTGSLVMGAGTVQLLSSNTFTHNVYFATNGTFDTAGNSPTLAGTLTGAVALTNGFTKQGLGTMTLTGASPNLSGYLNITAGTLALAGNGYLPQITNVSLNGGQFLIDDSGTNSTSRLSAQTRVNGTGGEFYFLGNSSASSSTTVGTLLASSGSNFITVQPGSGQSATLTFSRYTLTSTAGLANAPSLVFRGTALGSTGANTSQIFLTAQSEGFLYGAAYDNSTTGLGSYPAYYDTTVGVRAALDTDYYNSTSDPTRVIQNSATVSTPTTADVLIDTTWTTGQSTESNTIASLTMKPGATLAISNTLTLSTGALVQQGTGSAGYIYGGTITSGAVRLTASLFTDLTLGSALTTTGGLLKLGSGNLTLNGVNTISGGITIQSGTITLGGIISSGNSLTVNGTFNLGSNSVSVTTLSGTGTINTGTSSATTFNLTSTSASAAQTFNGTITGSGSLNYTPTSSSSFFQLILNGASTFSGGVTGNASAIYQIGNPSAFGTGTVNLTAQTASSSSTSPTVAFALGNGVSGTIANNFLLPTAGGFSTYFGGITSIGQTIALSGLITGGSTTASTKFVIADSASIESTTIILTNPNNSFTDTIRVEGGSLEFTSDGALGNSANTLELVSPNISGALRFDSNFTLVRTVNFAATTGSSTTIAVNGSATATFTGTLSSTNSPTLTKIGTGNLVLANATNTFTGPYTVNAGTLTVDTVIPVSSGGYIVTINPNATLSGTGTINRTVQINNGGTLSPGTSANPGILTVAGGVTFLSSSNFTVRLNGNTPGSGGYDQLSVTGSTQAVNIGGANLNVSLGYTPASSDQLFILVVGNTGNTLTGTFAGLSNGATLNIGTNYTAQIGYSGSFANSAISGGSDVVLYNFQPVPEIPGILSFSSLIFLVYTVLRKRLQKAI